LTGATKLRPSHCFLIQKQRIPWSFSEFLFVYWQVQPKCFQIIVYELKRWIPWIFSKSQSFFSSCIGSCNQNAFKSWLRSWKAMNSWRLSNFLFAYWQVQSECFQIIAFQWKSNEFLEASQSFYSCSGRCNQHAFNFFQLKRNDFLEIPAHFSKFLVVQWQVQSEMLPNHCFSIEMN
jgi:hypothetical protein